MRALCYFQRREGCAGRGIPAPPRSDVRCSAVSSLQFPCIGIAALRQSQPTQMLSFQLHEALLTSERLLHVPTLPFIDEGRIALVSLKRDLNPLNGLLGLCIF